MSRLTGWLERRVCWWCRGEFTADNPAFVYCTAKCGRAHRKCDEQGRRRGAS